MTKVSEVFKHINRLLLAIFIGVLIWCVIGIKMFTERELVPRLNARDAQVASLLKTVDVTSRQNADNLSQTLTNLRALTGDADDSLEQITNALLDDKFGILPRAGAVLDSLNVTVQDLDKSTLVLNSEIEKTGLDVREQLKPLSGALDDVSGLLEAATAQIQINGHASADTLTSLNRALADADRVVADPHIQQTLAHVDSSMESIDIALKPWRKKATLLKLILTKLMNVAIVAVPTILK